MMKKAWLCALIAAGTTSVLLGACSKQDHPSTESQWETPHTDNPAPATSLSTPSAAPEPAPENPVQPDAKSAPAEPGGWQPENDTREAPAAEGAATPVPTNPGASQ